MSRKDYEAIAAAIKRASALYGPYGFMDQTIGIKTAAESIALALQADNPRFDRERFMQACGF